GAFSTHFGPALGLGRLFSSPGWRRCRRRRRRSPRPSRLRPRSGTAVAWHGGAWGGGGWQAAPVTPAGMAAVFGAPATGAAAFGTTAGGPGGSCWRSVRSGRGLFVLRLRLLRHLLAESPVYSPGGVYLGYQMSTSASKSGFQ